MIILVKIASRQRPDKLWETVADFVEKAHHPIRILVSLDDDDRSTLDKFPKGLPGTITKVGKRVSKIEAINRDLAGESWDVVVIAADDMVPLPGWDDSMVGLLRGGRYNTPMAFWCNDGRQNRLCTIPAMTRAYFDLDGHVFNPEYLSYFCDDEWTEKAQARGMLHKIHGPQFRHDHPFWVRAGNDGLYDFNRQFKRQDRETYFRRKLAGFP